MVTKKIFAQVDRLNWTPREKTFLVVWDEAAEGAVTVAGDENNFSFGAESASRKSSWGILFAVGQIIRPAGDIYTA
jgi:hypothetical protein